MGRKTYIRDTTQIDCFIQATPSFLIVCDQHAVLLTHKGFLPQAPRCFSCKTSCCFPAPATLCEEGSYTTLPIIALATIISQINLYVNRFSFFLLFYTQKQCLPKLRGVFSDVRGFLHLAVTPILFYIHRILMLYRLCQLAALSVGIVCIVYPRYKHLSNGI